MKLSSRLDLLMIAINRCLETPRFNRSMLCGEVIEAIKKLNLVDVLEREGITFNTSDDLFNDMRVNAQKLFRWLGQYEGQHAFPDRLFHLEQAIVAAMPEHIRLDYLNSVYNMVDVIVCLRSKATLTTGTAQEIISSSVKESSEAHVALIGLESNPTDNQILAAYKEAGESAVAATNTVGYLENTYPDVIKNSNGLKAVS